MTGYGLRTGVGEAAMGELVISVRVAGMVNRPLANRRNRRAARLQHNRERNDERSE
ncbi:MAG: hypothetical protein LC737_08150 [Chloroflexi bacterium]|nr:hypothetical protein [Chloroflexota bacterium]